VSPSRPSKYVSDPTWQARRLAIFRRLLIKLAQPLFPFFDDLRQCFSRPLVGDPHPQIAIVPHLVPELFSFKLHLACSPFRDYKTFEQLSARNVSAPIGLPRRSLP
jgi:hypothetical protein